MSRRPGTKKPQYRSVRCPLIRPRPSFLARAHLPSLLPPALLSRFSHQDGTFVSKSGSGGDVTGPGLWVTGVRGKEKICVAETYDVLEAVSRIRAPLRRLAFFAYQSGLPLFVARPQLVEEMYPGAQEEYRKMKDAWRTAHGGEGEKHEESDDEDDIEKQVAKELAEMASEKKQRTKKLANLIGEPAGLEEGRRGRGNPLN